MKPIFIVTCSCGRKCRILWSEKHQRYVGMNPGFAPSYPAGWTCGRWNHHQLVPPEIEGPRLQQQANKIVV